MNKLSRTDVADIKRLDGVRRKPSVKKERLLKKIAQLEDELDKTNKEVESWERLIENISGASYAETMDFINGKATEHLIMTGIQSEGISEVDPTLPENEAGPSVETTEQNIF